MKLFLILLTLTVSFAEATVQNTCALERPAVSTVRTLDDLTQNVCSHSSSSNDQEIQATTEQSLSIIRRLAANPVATPEGEAPADPLNNDELVSSLDRVAALITDRRAPAQFTSTRNDEVSTALNQLFVDYPTVERRNGDQQGYYRSLKNVLSKTNQGRRVLECFERSENGVSGSRVVFADLGNNAPTATFGLERDDNGNRIKTISITTVDHPSFMLSLLAHEFQHSCNTQEMITLEEQGSAAMARLQGLIQSPGTDEEMQAAITAQQSIQARSNIRAAIDELRAYRMTPQIFDELAPYHPSYFCQQYYVSGLFGRQILNNGEYMSTLETKVADGSFAHQLIDTYTRINGYDPAAFYEMDATTGDIRRDSQGRPVFLAAVREEIEREGFRVQ